MKMYTPVNHTDKSKPLDEDKAVVGIAAGSGTGLLAYVGFGKLRENSNEIKELLKKTNATSIEEARKIARETIDTTKKAIVDLYQIEPLAGSIFSRYHRDYREIISVKYNALNHLVDIEKALTPGAIEKCMVAGVAVGTGVLVYHMLQRNSESPTSQIDGASAKGIERTVSQEKVQHSV